ncbi:MAG: hypothetical protein COB02_07715 [Candidatus Cloacimonadota bacterium]|nr:MAG: hypothetical protein COB02_07715 [Candidatus Cloacimonadota bacterium]
MSTTISNIKKRVLSPDEDFEVSITYDCLESYLLLKPCIPGKSYILEEVLEIISKEGIVNGVLTQEIVLALDAYNNTGEIAPKILIVKATPAIQGKNASVFLNFEIDIKPVLKVDADGNIDYRDVGFINNVEKGQLLARKTPLVEGKPGLNIYGEDVPPSHVRDDNFVSGKNTEVSENGLECYSTIDGQVLLKRKMINVSPVYTVPHDVDFSTGNISFNGSVIVNGNVLSGFTIKAQEDITVMGTVEASTLIAGGNIFIKTGFKGADKGLIKAKGSLTTKFVEAGNVECYGEMLVETSIINSNVICYANIKVTSSKGLIVGGEIKCIGNIFCNEMGSKLGVTTKVILGDKFFIRQRMDESQGEINQFQEQYSKIKKSLIPIQSLLNNLDSLAPAKKAQFEIILKQQELIKQQIDQLEAKKKKLMALYNVICRSKLYVMYHAFPNTAMTIGTSKKTLKEIFTNSSFYEDPIEKVITLGSHPPPENTTL